MSKYILGYVTEKASVTREDALRLTHICAAFGRLCRDGSIIWNHPVQDCLDEIRTWNPEIRVLLSLVNQSGEQDAFTAVCGDSQRRESFAAHCAELVEKHGYDGVDLDWEYPCVPSNFQDACPEDRENFTETLRAIRRAFDALRGKKPLLTIAAGADLYYAASVDLPAVAETVDFINLMTYDLKCGFHALSGHHTSLYSSTGDYFRNSCDQALRLFTAHGVPKEKLLMGCAFYSRKWENVPDRNHGFLQLTKRGGGYGPRWEELEKDYLDRNGFVYFWDDEAKAPFLFNGSTFLSFDDPHSLREKCDYVNREGYGGIFYWEHSCDPAGKLLDTLYRGMNGIT